MKKEIGIRLREQRLKTGLSQEKFGVIGGVKLKSQSDYERGVRSPDSEYLASVSHIVDVAYIIEGGEVLDAVQEQPTKYSVDQIRKHHGDIRNLLDMTKEWPLELLNPDQVDMVVTMLGSSPLTRHQLDLMMASFTLEKRKGVRFIKKD